MRPATCRTVLLALQLLGWSVGIPAPAYAEFEPVTHAMLQNPAAGDWLSWRRTTDGWGYSPLTQINRDNITALALVWTRPLGPGVQEATPLVYRGVMYMPNPGDIIQAIDAISGDLLWEYRRPIPNDVKQYIPYPGINRNIAIYGNVLIDTANDDYLFAVDATTGKLAWETRINDYHLHPSQHSSGPIIANGKVISGRGCEPRGGPAACVITAHDAGTGIELWRTSTIQLPGDGDDTWGGVPLENRWHVGTWMVPSYDPVLDRIYIGTSVTSPAPKFMLAGNDERYLYHNSTLALDANTGRIDWYYQHVVDHWDLDHPFERILVDTAVAPDPAQVRWINPRLRRGEIHKVVTGIPGKTGIVYTLDRETGEFLWATETIRQNVVADINPATGAATVNPATLFTAAGQTRFICPGISGGKNWPAGAYSPVTNTIYMPLQNTCRRVTSLADKPSLDSLYAITGVEQITPGTENIGTIFAIAVDTGLTVWRYEQRASTTALVATGGGLLLGGDSNGRFHAWDARTGDLLWTVNLGSEVTGYPITYAVGGRQFVAVSTGTSLTTSSHISLAPELHPAKASNLYVFALPE